jgi:hypothetical protein
MDATTTNKRPTQQLSTVPAAPYRFEASVQGANIDAEMRRTREELQGVSDAVLYELQMLFGTAQSLRDEVQGPTQGTLAWPQKMASIEAFAIHARVLEAFLWDKPSKHHLDDALAIDFFADGEWEAIRDRIQRSELDELRDRAGHEIAHLSYKRVNKADDARRWKFDVIAGVIGNAFRLFLEHVNPDVLCNGFEHRLRASWPEYLNFPIAMSFPPNCDTAPAITVASESLQDVGQLHQATFEEMLPKDRPQDRRTAESRAAG